MHEYGTQAQADDAKASEAQRIQLQRLHEENAKQQEMLMKFHAGAQAQERLGYIRGLLEHEGDPEAQRRALLAMVDALTMLATRY